MHSPDSSDCLYNSPNCRPCQEDETYEEHRRKQKKFMDFYRRLSGALSSDLLPLHDLLRCADAIPFPGSDNEALCSFCQLFQLHVREIKR